MSKRQLKISKEDSDLKIQSQIDKGIDLVEEGVKTTERGSNSYRNTITTDNFQIKYKHWEAFTKDILQEIFVDYSYASEFEDHKSSKVEYVSSSWQPDINYYIGTELIPKIEYLKILKENLKEFDVLKKTEVLQLKMPKILKTQPTTKVNLENYTLPQLFHSLTISQWSAIIGGIITIISISFAVGYNWQQWQLEKENRELY